MGEKQLDQIIKRLDNRKPKITGFELILGWIIENLDNSRLDSKSFTVIVL